MTITKLRPGQIEDVPKLAGLTSLLFADNTRTTIDNDATETTVYTDTLLADTLGANGFLRITHFGLTTRNMGADKDLTFRLKLGATTLVTLTHLNVSDGKTDLPTKVEFILKADGGTSAQLVIGMSHVYNDSTSATAFIRVVADSGTGAEDTTGNLTLSITAQNETANANEKYVAETTFVEYVKAR
jgi:hypothetical protein